MGLQVPVSLPAGSISPFAGATAPDGWLFMYGQAVSRATYAALFLAIGTTFGAGDGSTTFNLPDARGRTLFGKDNMGGTPANRITAGFGGLDGVTLGAVGGGETVTLTEGEMPAHNHIEGVGLTAYGGRYGTLDTGMSTTALSSSAYYGTAGVGNKTQSKGSSVAHKNIPPAMVFNYIIKT